MKIDKTERAVVIEANRYNGLAASDKVNITVVNKQAGTSEAIALTADEFYGLVAAGRTVFNGGREPV